MFRSFDFTEQFLFSVVSSCFELFRVVLGEHKEKGNTNSLNTLQGSLVSK